MPLHAHRWPAVLHLLSWSDFVRRDAEGRVLVDTRGRPAPAEIPLTLGSEVLPPRTSENVGAGELTMLSIEVKAAP